MTANAPARVVGDKVLTRSIDLPGGLTLRAARTFDTVFLGELYASTRADLRSLADPDLSHTLIELQFRAQTEATVAITLTLCHFIVGLHQDRIGRLILDFSAGRVHVVDISLIPPHGTRPWCRGASGFAANRRTHRRPGDAGRGQGQRRGPRALHSSRLLFRGRPWRFPRDPGVVAAGAGGGQRMSLIWNRPARPWTPPSFSI